MFELLAFFSDDYHLYGYPEVYTAMAPYLPHYYKFPCVANWLGPILSAALELRLRETFEAFKRFTRVDDGHDRRKDLLRYISKEYNILLRKI